MNSERVAAIKLLLSDIDPLDPITIYPLRIIKSVLTAILDELEEKEDLA